MIANGIRSFKAVRFFIGAVLLLCCPMLSKAQWDKDVLEFRGRLALQDGRYAAAIDQFNILASLDTTDYWTYFYRGIAKYNLGDLRGSMKDFDRSIRLNPVFTNGYHYRAIVKSRFGEYEDALDDFQTAIELRPGNTGLYFSRGVTYFLSQRFDEAVDDFDKYLRYEKNDPSAYLNRGACFLFLENYDRALEDYNKAIRIDRFEPEGYIRRARLHATRDNYPEAIDDMNKAIDLDENNTLAYFNRALMYFEVKDFNRAMSDLNRVLEFEPGNALTLYNRSLISMQMGNFEDAVDDMDRVININPKNVLAYFNRAACFIELGRWKNALNDYSRAIELYPDFAKAYQNRAYVENQLGMKKQSKADYETARKKIREYQEGSATGNFADTTRKYSSLISFDAEFAKKDFDNELLQHRDIDIRLRPLYRVALSKTSANTVTAFSNRYENKAVDSFTASTIIPTRITNDASVPVDGSLAGYNSRRPDVRFLSGIRSFDDKQYNAALLQWNAAIEDETNDGARAFYLLNRAALKAEMISFIASMESNVQTLTMDDKGVAKTRVSDRTEKVYDYSEAIEDMLQADSLAPGVAYIQYNLGNLYCLSSQPVNAVEWYNKAISEYPAMGDAYFNRGLVLVFLKDKEKGCIDLSRAGELGVGDAYAVIKKYCMDDNE